MKRSPLVFVCFLVIAAPASIRAWSWDSAENLLPSLREDLDREIAMYRQQVVNGLGLQDRIAWLDRLIDNYKPLGVNMAELEVERSRLILEERQAQLRASADQDKATQLFNQGVSQYREGKYKMALDNVTEAERLVPQDASIKELRRRLTNLSRIIEAETGDTRESEIVRLAITRYLENDPKRAINALIYADDKKFDRPDLLRVRQLIEADHPELEAPKRSAGMTLVEQKLQTTLEAIYDGRYLSAISECNDVLDLEPQNVMALTRLGSAYFAMNEREKARQIWTKALQYDPNNDVLKKFLYSGGGASRVERR